MPDIAERISLLDFLPPTLPSDGVIFGWHEANPYPLSVVATATGCKVYRTVDGCRVQIRGLSLPPLGAHCWS